MRRDPTLIPNNTANFDLPYRATPSFVGYEVNVVGCVRSYKVKIGRIWSIGTTPRQLTACVDTKGYPRFCISVSGRHRYPGAHQLVLEAFVGPCPEGMESCHNDGDSRNCRLDNLRWDTHSNNTLDKATHGTFRDIRGELNPSAKLKLDQVIEIKLLIAKGLGNTKIASRFGLTHHKVSEIRRGVNWAWVVVE